MLKSKISFTLWRFDRSINITGRMITIWSLYFVHDWSKTYYSDLSLVHQPHFASTGCNYYLFSFISHNLSQRQIVSKKVKKNYINRIYIFHKKIEPLVNEDTKDKAIVKFWWTKSENYILTKSVFCNDCLHYIEQNLLCLWVKTEGF